MSSVKLAKKVVVTRQIYAKGLDLLRSKVDEVIVYDEDKGMPEEEMKEAVKGAHGIICMLSDKIHKGIIEAAGDNLQCISTYSAGFDHIDLEECKKRGIVVGNTPKVLTNATADLTVSLVLDTARLIPRAIHAAKSGEWGTWKPMWLCGSELAGKTCGIVGMGSIGYAVARRLHAFDVENILYFGRSQKLEAEEKIGAKKVAFEELLENSDIIVVTCALTPETKHLFNAEAFKKMKPNAILVNTARGGCVDQDALVEALQTGEIQAAGLDVTTPEPLPTDHPLFQLDNCIITPHIGSASVECRTVMSVLAVENALAGMTGSTMPAQVNF
eukprot:m.136444 g.136444  ORF g.136444 m.136444 type:complete len:329 (-) comp10672_c0_seq1:138-1124(-)